MRPMFRRFVQKAQKFSKVGLRRAPAHSHDLALDARVPLPNLCNAIVRCVLRRSFGVRVSWLCKGPYLMFFEGARAHPRAVGEYFQDNGQA